MGKYFNRFMDGPTARHLVDAFDEIKGRDNKHRIYADFDSFKAALAMFKPECMEEHANDPAACENLSTLEEAKIYTGEKPEIFADLEESSSEGEVPDEGEEDENMKPFTKESNI